MNPKLTVYKASAGSGKTFTLAVEYITLLIAHPGDNEYAHTLAVTFTNKATAEMKDRIVQQLYGIGNGLESSKGYLDVIKKTLQGYGMTLSDEKIRNRAKTALKQILHDYTHFRVETIDAFFQSILRDLARELGLNANLQVELDNEAVISMAVDRIIDNLQFNVHLQEWILSYVNEQIEESGRWNIANNVKDFAKCIFMESFQNRTDDERERLDDNGVVNAFKGKMRKIENDSSESIRETAATLQNNIKDMELDFGRISRGAIYNGYLEKLANGQYEEMGKTLMGAIEDYTKLVKAADRKSPSLMSEAMTISEELGKLKKTYEENITKIYSARLARRHINPMRLLGEIEKQVDEINQENNQFNLSKTPVLLSELVKSNDASFVFEKSGTTFHNIMIDEFQDTSKLQWKNFKTLLFENQSTGGVDLLVGDVKQSIYRWRNGDWSILQNIDKELGHLQPNILPKNENFRSMKKVVEFNNDFFEAATKKIDALEPDAKFKIEHIYSDVSQTAKKEDDKGYVYVKLFQKAAKDIDYETCMVQDMISKIRMLKDGGVDYRNMAILVRANKHCTQLIERFNAMEAKIPLVSDEAFHLQSSMAIQILVNALRVLAGDKKKNAVPLYSLARNYQYYVLKKEKMTADDAFLADPEKGLPEEFVLGINDLKMMPLYSLCEHLYNLFQLKEMEKQEPYVCCFFDGLQGYLSDNPGDINSFLDFWDKKMCKDSIPCGETDGLRILTIHRAKGLEYHTVLIPYMDGLIIQDRGTLWCRTHESPYNDLGLLPITQGKEMRNSVFKEDIDEEHLQSKVDVVNVLYVAFTRACSNLFVWGATNGNLTNSSVVGDLIHAALDDKMQKDENTEWYEYGEPVFIQKESDKSDNRMLPDAEGIRVDFHSVDPRLDFKQSNQSQQFIRNLSEGQEATQSYIEIGNILHYVLSQIRDVDDVDAVLTRCRNQGLITDEKMQNQVLNRIKHGFKNVQIRNWFSSGNTVFNECSITYIDKETGEPNVRRPDRVIMTDNDITVIDFKFGSHKEEHIGQVQEYLRLMQQMYPQKIVYGFLWYIYKGEVCPVEL